MTRVVLDTRGVARHSLFTLYNPYRLVIDMYREPGALTQKGPTPAPTMAASAPRIGGPDTLTPRNTPRRRDGHRDRSRHRRADRRPTRRCRPRPAGPNVAAAPAAPESNSSGNYSLARQLGLGVSRIVIDAGHGGHDAGALGDGIREAELVLDVALRVEKLLKQEAGIDVVMTRRTDEFIELEERTRIANRQNADMFLSIHANSSRRKTAQGIETFVLNFANTSDAEEVAARENAIAKGSMRQLPDIVKAITLNNKLDESRDLAEIVQGNLVSRLRKTESELPDRGIKQAPARGADRSLDAERAGRDRLRQHARGRRSPEDREVPAGDRRSAARCGAPLPAFAQGQHDGLADAVVAELQNFRISYDRQPRAPDAAEYLKSAIRVAYRSVSEM